MCNIKCPWGWYGLACKDSCAGHCRGNQPCNHVTGQCEAGCANGWMGKLCDEPCKNGFYGPGCVHNCSSHCLNNTYCRRETGHCDNGCNPGYTEEFCNKPCTLGFFGNNCHRQCSTKCKNKRCDHIDGTCLEGCLDGFDGRQCLNICKEGYFGSNCSNVCSCNNSCNHTDGSCNQGVENVVHLEDESTNASTIGGILGAFVVIIILVLLAVLFIRFKRRALAEYFEKTKKEAFSPVESKKEASSTTVFSNLKDEHKESVRNRTSVLRETAKKGPPTNKTIPVRNLKATIVKMSAAENAGFKHEYHEIPKGELYSCEEAKKPENKAKNRYTSTFPYDHSRVVLKKPHGGDYINANYIENVLDQRNYIATQGPKPKTIADFWQMIWQENVSVIVCLTNLKEGGKNKCAQYWPDISDKLQTGDFTLRHLEEKGYSNYTTRRFKAYNNLEKKDREVLMYHYTRWPDHGVPDPLSLVVFHRHVMKTSPKTGKYTLVHCSAGIGRTGTYIALDALYREGERSSRVNVPMYVRTMRKDRMNMIQSDDQFKAVYLALCEYFNGKSRCLTPSMLTKEFQDKTYTNCGQVTKSSSLSSEFQELLSLRKEYTEKDYESGRTNISANYTESVLPVEEFLCYLSYTKGRNTYYNAVLLQSFTENDSLISAQYPLPDYTEDFLRLIGDFDARVVVFMCPIKDLKSTSLWIPTKSEHKNLGNFTLKLASSTNSTNFASRKIVLQSEGGRTMEITVLECKAWKEGKLTIDKRALLDLIKETKTEKFKHKGGRVAILSSDGATRCGAFCVVYNALEQLSIDQEVDIFTITRQLQIRRPEFVSSLDEYQLCQDAVAEYMQSDSVYANC
ncbi:receptor-type tyrosine-protein phosphatase epsilon-like [Saccostrea cucullata]|uniref:receptor-type tyrosine-protein phosphatase epsilon-like n=1 Tax=Saccostrea cuccullata TaxID=36930 RepID=UPI002ED423AB